MTVEIQDRCLQPSPPTLTRNGTESADRTDHADAGLSQIDGAGPMGRFITSLRAARPLFVCVAAHTDVSSIPGISAAGASTELIPFTPAADLEALAFGRPRCLGTVPSNPLGPPGPALITRAALALASIPWLAITIGLPIPPAIEALTLPHAPGARIDLYPGVTDASAIFDRGIALGASLAERGQPLIIAETVPGGTTTAMAVLRALGLPDRVSSSAAGDVHVLKANLVSRALARARLSSGARALEVVAEVGDPMQPLVAGMLFGAVPTTSVLLAGGTQMAAVLALTQRLETELGRRLDRSRVLLGTTPWVAQDPYADLRGILRASGGWAAATPTLDFSRMRCLPLRAYEQFLVKEGVGAGGAALGALARGTGLKALHAEIDAQYQQLLSPQ